MQFPSSNEIVSPTHTYLRNPSDHVDEIEIEEHVDNLSQSILKRKLTETTENFQNTEKKIKQLSDPLSIQRVIQTDHWKSIVKILDSNPQALIESKIYNEAPEIQAYKPQYFWRQNGEYTKYFFDKWNGVKFDDENSILEILKNFASFIPKNFVKHIITNIVRENRWGFINRILEIYPGAILESNFFGEAPDIKAFKRFALARWSVNTENEKLMIKILKDFSASFPSNFILHLVINMIRESRWNFVKLILDSYPQALNNSSFFNEIPDYEDYHKRAETWSVKKHDEKLILNLLKNFPSNFVLHLTINMIREFRWDFVKEILEIYPHANSFLVSVSSKIAYILPEEQDPSLLDLYRDIFEKMKETPHDSFIKDFITISANLKSKELLEKVLNLPTKEGIGPVIDKLGCDEYGFSEPDIKYLLNQILKIPTESLKKHAEILLRIAHKCNDKLAKLEIFRRFPEINLEVYCVPNKNQLEELLQFAAEFDVVKQALGKNIHHLLKWCAEGTFYMLDDPDQAFKDEDLKKILRVYPECDLTEYTDIVLNEYKLWPIEHIVLVQICTTLLEHANLRDDQYQNLIQAISRK